MRKVVAISGCSAVVMWNGFTAGEVHGDPAAGRAIFFDAGRPRIAGSVTRSETVAATWDPI